MEGVWRYRKVDWEFVWRGTGGNRGYNVEGRMGVMEWEGQRVTMVNRKLECGYSND